MESKKWYESWFDTDYYHTLYQNRNESEAAQFIGKLVHFLKLPKGTKVVDLACGKGRHSVTLNELGMDVLGVDLSANSICFATQFKNEALHFAVHDMREPLKSNDFDVVFNLFTSFGYFDSVEDNHKVIECIYKMLKDEGLVVIDFMNSKKAINNLIPAEVKIMDGIAFDIERSYTGTHLQKKIAFKAEDGAHEYTEKVQALTQSDFETLLSSNNFQIIHTFGDFDLNPFDEITSDRLILIATKN